MLHFVKFVIARKICLINTALFAPKVKIFNPE